MVIVCSILAIQMIAEIELVRIVVRKSSVAQQKMLAVSAPHPYLAVHCLQFLYPVIDKVFQVFQELNETFGVMVCLESLQLCNSILILLNNASGKFDDTIGLGVVFFLCHD